MKRTTKTITIVIALAVLTLCCSVGGTALYFYRLKRDAESAYQSYPAALSAFKVDQRDNLTRQYKDLEEERSNAWFAGDDSKILELNKKAEDIEKGIDAVDSETGIKLDARGKLAITFGEKAASLPGGMLSSFPGIGDDREIGMKMAREMSGENDLEKKWLGLERKRTKMFRDLDDTYARSAQGTLEILAFSDARNKILSEIDENTKEQEALVKTIGQRSEDVRRLWDDYE